MKNKKYINNKNSETTAKANKKRNELSVATIAQRERREREALAKARNTLENRIPVYEGKELIGYTDTLKVSSNAEFRKDLGIALRKPKRKYTKKMPVITTKKSKNGCFPLIFIAYLLFWLVYGWMNTSEIVEAKIDTVSDVKVEEVKTTTLDIKTQPEVILEEITPIFDSTEQDLRNYIELKFAPLGEEAVAWALFTANQESRFMTRPHNMQDDHSAWCNLENGSHGLYHFSTCTYAGLGGTEIMNPYEQIDIVSRPEVYNRRAFYWVYSTNLFENR